MSGLIEKLVIVSIFGIVNSNLRRYA